MSNMIISDIQLLKTKIKQGTQKTPLRNVGLIEKYV